MRAGPTAATGTVVSAPVWSDRTAPHVLRWRLPEPPGAVPSDPLLPATLLLAMRRGQDVQLEGGVSPRLLGAVDAVQDLILGWDADVRRRAPGPRPPQRRALVEAEPRTPGRRAPGVAAFFTAGVDSFYTAIRHADELDALIYVHGFDVPLRQRGLRARVVRGIRRAAAALGLPLVEVESDVRYLSDGTIGWNAYHGAALATVAHLLAPSFGTVYVPATLTVGRLAPLGSHPELDPLWSTEEVELVHDGHEAERMDKLRLVAECGAAHETLRVCWQNYGGAYNCGRCEKCLRTMLTLVALGRLEAFRTFPPLEPRRMARLVVPRRSVSRLPAWELAVQALEESGTAPATARTARRSLALWTQLPPSALRTAVGAVNLVRSSRTATAALRPPRVGAATVAEVNAYLEADTGVGPDHVDVAVVFGSQSLQPALMAADILRAGQADWLLLTGGVNVRTGVNEARRNLEVLVAEGVPTDRVLVEDTFTSTTENVVLSLPLLAERFPGGGPRTVLVVAKWHHARRSVLTLRRHLGPGVRYWVMGYDPGDATRAGWQRTAWGRHIVLDEWRALRSDERSDPEVEVSRDGDAWT